MKNIRNIVVINEQHNLLPQQQKIITTELGDNIELMKIPAEGINRQQIEKMVGELDSLTNVNIIVLSPIPLLLARLAHISGAIQITQDGMTTNRVWILHNDRREKKELPNGKIISVVAQEGWELIEV